MRNTIITAGLILASASSYSQLTLDFTPQVIIKPDLGVIQVVNSNDFLQCTVEIIEDFSCGSDSTTMLNGNCNVDKNTAGTSSVAFNLNWDVNGADSCWGTQGTSEWRTTLPPFAGGTGNYTKRMYSGITEDTTFQLNCADASSFGYSGKVAFQDYTAFTITEASHSLVVWDGKGVHFHAKSSYREEKEVDSVLIESGMVPFIAITDKKPVKTNTGGITYTEMGSEGLCSTMGETGVVGLHISPSKMFLNTCPLKANKEYYLVTVLLANGKKTSLNPYEQK